MPPSIPELPTRIETARLVVRTYQPGDGSMYFAMSQRNKSHLARYESGNAVMKINTVEEAELVVRDFIADWKTRSAFFMGAFRRDTGEFAAQIYNGMVNWDLPEFELGYFADVDQQGQGYVTEAAKAALNFSFKYLGAQRVRLETDDTNLRSFRVAEACGMVKEGWIRENHRHADGSITGTLIYGLLRTEFLAGQ
jgi:ribosomal-protein-alanine N-acetyltransferase